MVGEIALRVLVLTSADRALDNRGIWSALGEHHTIDIRFLDKRQQRGLRRFFDGIDSAAYDRIVLDLMFKHIHKQAWFLRTLPALTMYEEDAYLDVMPGSRWLGAFLKLYHRLPGLRVISTGHMVTRHLRASGVDAYFIPKGFDPVRLQDQGRSVRDIELGFIGRLGSAAYSGRRTMLESLAQRESLQILRTTSAEEYLETLNRIRCFVSADVGLGEYMAKNFEAMACGCLLIAMRQGQGEEEALGFVDESNVLLYDDLNSLCSKVAWVRENPERAMEIAQRGREHVLAHNTYAHLANKVAQVVAQPFSPLSPVSWWRWW